MANLVSEAVKQTIHPTNGFSRWKDTLQDILDKNLAVRANGNVASFGMQSDRATYLFAFFKKLHGLGYKVEPQNLREKHVKAVFAEYEKEGLAASTMQKYISHLRQFAHWIGKGNMIGAAELYVKDKLSVTRVYMATEDKSLDTNGIDKYEILQKIFEMDLYVGVQVLLQDAFGLRRRESVCARPYVMERNGMITVTDGTKGGKVRTLPVDSELKARVLLKAQQSVNFTQAHLGNPKNNLKQNLYRYSNVLKRCGVTKDLMGKTGHGLRAGFAMRELENLGLLPVLRGGKIGSIDKEKEKEIRLAVSRLLGHNRTSVTTAYSGAQTYHGLLKLSKVESMHMEKMLASMEVGKSYRFTTFEYVTPDGEVMEAQRLDRIYLGTTQVEERFYFEVERTSPQLEHVLAIEHVRNITPHNS